MTGAVYLHPAIFLSGAIFGVLTLALSLLIAEIDEKRRSRRSDLQNAARVLSDGSVRRMKRYYTDEAIENAVREGVSPWSFSKNP